MGRISALFKADGDETAGRYSISEWWLEPNTQGPGAHSHAEDDIFYVLEGTMSILLGERRAGLLNFSIPGNFEKDMPSIAEWFAEHPPKDAR
jgi:hypothetical protein